MGLSALSSVFEKWSASHLVRAKTTADTLSPVLLLAHLYNRHVHVVDVTSLEQLHLIRAAKARGIAVTCSVSPWTLAAGDARFWEFLSTIDTFTSAGYPDAALPALLTFVSEQRLTQDELVARISANPARIFGVLLPEDTFIEVDVQSPRSLTTSPLPDATAVGAVGRVMVNAELAFLDGKLVAAPGSGALLKAEHVALPIETAAAAAPSTPATSTAPRTRPAARERRVSIQDLEFSPPVPRRETPFAPSTVISHELTGKSILTIHQARKEEEGRRGRKEEVNRGSVRARSSRFVEFIMSVTFSFFCFLFCLFFVFFCPPFFSPFPPPFFICSFRAIRCGSC